MSSGNLKKRADVLMEDGEICETSIPDFSLNEGDRGVTVIEDHTMVMCGGMKTNGDGMTFKLYLNVIIMTWARLRQATGESDAINRVRFLYICRALGHLS